MAAPVVAGKDIWTSGTTSATSHTISFGAGVGTVASGDMLVIVVTYGVTGNTVGLTGYTEVLSRERTAGATEGMSSWKLTASGGETSAALSFTTASKATAHVYRITSGDIASVVAAGADAANANPDPPALTITSGDWLFIAAAGVGNPSGTWSVDPTGYANGINTTTTGGSATTNTTSRTTDKSVTGSGTSEDPSAYTDSLSVSWVAMTIGIPAGGASTFTASAAVDASPVIATSAITEHVRSVAMDLSSLLATSSLVIRDRSVVIDSSPVIASSGTVSGASIDRSAAVDASPVIATSGFRVLDRTVAMDASSVLATSGLRIVDRTVAVDPSPVLASSSLVIRIRTVAVDPSPVIASSGSVVGTITRSVAMDASPIIASAALVIHLRTVGVDLSPMIASAGSGVLIIDRSASLDASLLLAATGLVIGSNAGQPVTNPQVASLSHRGTAQEIASEGKAVQLST
jgi:hypothetical protein